MTGVARDLGIRENLLWRWKKEIEEYGVQAFAGQASVRDEQLLRLRCELAQVKKERDFLTDKNE